MASYPSILEHRKRSVLPPALQNDLQRLGKSLESARAEAADVATVIDGLSDLPVRDFKAAAGDIMEYGRLYGRHSYDKWTTAAARVELRSMIRHLERTHGLEFVFLFHGNGYYRQSALELIDGPLEAPFLLSAIIYRLNDWVPEVRQEAHQCALRVFAVTPVAIVVPAVVGMLEMRARWQRGVAEAVIVDEVLSRPDVQAGVTAYLMRTPAGSVARTLSHLLRDSRFDDKLPALSRHARHPAVRTLALRTRLAGQARWPVGVRKQWIDKSMGIERRAVEFASRPVVETEAIEALIHQGAGDRAAAVRKVAMQAIVDRPALWPQMAPVIEMLAQDSSSAIRGGIAYIVRHRKGL